MMRMEYLKYRVLLRIMTDKSHDALEIAFYCVLPGYQADVKQQQDADSYVI